MKQHRIGYIDALRGFTMFLVVYYHVLICSFDGGSAWSINDIFLTFRMPLFFFLSGFLMYKKNRFRETTSLGRFLQKKGFVQLFPTLLFSLIYVLIFSIPYDSLLLDKAKCGYWFTFTLFFYFLIYAVGDHVISKFAKGKQKIGIGAFVACMIYAFSKFSLSPTCPWFSSPINGLLGFANFQFFLFFYSGTLVRAYFDKIELLLDKDSTRTGILIGFILMQFGLQLPISRSYIIETGSYFAYSLLRSISAFFGIAVVFIFFRKNEKMILRSQTGRFLQYIGVRTLDIYLIHLILIHTDMHFIGDFLALHNSFVCELVIGGAVSLLIIGLCLIISHIVRSSDTLAKVLFGKVIEE